MLRRARSSVESLPQDVLEFILERLPVVPLLRCKSVSKKWRWTIESQPFQKRQFMRRKQSRGPDVLFMRLNGDDDSLPTTIVFRSSLAWTVTFPMTGNMFCHGSCDGLVCIYCIHTPSVVVNPATKWHRTFPLSTSQHLREEKLDLPCPKLGFGKDTLSGTYKPVFLYNSSEFGLDDNKAATTCELFDFGTNAWRYVVPSSPYRIIPYHSPVYLDGSLYWFTECEEPNVLSFNLHTETFQVICKAPFAHPCDDPRSLTMCVLYDRLCVSQKKWPIQVIWSFDDRSKTWNQMCSIDLTETFYWFGDPTFPLSPIAILYKDQLLLQGPRPLDPVVIHELHTKSYRQLFKPTRAVGSVYYLQSLFSVLSN